MGLLCTSFDFENNLIEPGTLNMEDFNKANIPHFEKNEHTPAQQLNNIMESCYKAPMLTSTFTIQAYVPKKSDSTTNIDKLMKTLIEHSNWISMNKTESARKSISRLLSLSLIETLKDSTAHRVVKKFRQPQPASTFLIQTEVSIETYKKEVATYGGNDEICGYSDCTKGKIWDEFITNPFKKDMIEEYLNKISPKLMTDKKKKKSVSTVFGLISQVSHLMSGNFMKRIKRGEILMQDITIHT